MSNKHGEKYITNLLFGFSFITIGILSILFAAFERTHEDDWYLWGIVAALVINTGLYFMLKAFVHKVKSDFIKRQKLRDQQKTITIEL
ncbi:MAG: hypothetical protein JJE22_09235 [Bacteroidia bacterium]|nr:hypothetical protein [Bacteroidia bacterium]